MCVFLSLWQLTRGRWTGEEGTHPPARNAAAEELLTPPPFVATATYGRGARPLRRSASPSPVGRRIRLPAKRRARQGQRDTGGDREGCETESLGCASARGACAARSRTARIRRP